MGSIDGYFLMPHPPIIIPEVGKGEERKAQDTVDACLKAAEEIRDIQPDTIILVTPHGIMFSDAVAISSEERITGSLAGFSASQVKMDFEIDIELTKEMMKLAYDEGIPAAEINSNFLKRYGRTFELDHGTMVPLYFVSQKYSDFKLIHITYGMISPIQLYRFGMLIKKVIEGSSKRAVFIASGDLSHRLKDDGPYGYNEEGPKFDAELLKLLKEGNIKQVFNMDHNMVEEAGECGLRSIYTMLGSMEGNTISGRVLSYEGPFGVGYGIMNFDIKKGNTNYLNEIIEEKRKKHTARINNEDLYVKLARESLTHYIVEGTYMKTPDYVTNEMKNTRRGVFVSLKKFGELRGCIGTITPVTESITEEIIRNAVEAGMQDPRFDPVEEDELEDIVFSVDVLTEPVAASKDELDPKKYGVIVSYGRKGALLLPDLEGINTVEEQLEAVLQKGNIRPHENYTIEKFEVIRHK